MSNTINISTGGTSQAIAVSATSVQSAVTVSAGPVVATPTVDVFVRRGTNPTALADGTDQILLAGYTYRIGGLVLGEKLAFISASSGTVYLTPGV